MIICRNQSTGSRLCTSPRPSFLPQWPAYLWMVKHLDQQPLNFFDGKPHEEKVSTLSVCFHFSIYTLCACATVSTDTGYLYTENTRLTRRQKIHGIFFQDITVRLALPFIGLIIHFFLPESSSLFESTSHTSSVSRRFHPQGQGQNCGLQYATVRVQDF